MTSAAHVMRSVRAACAIVALASCLVSHAARGAQPAAVSRDPIYDFNETTAMIPMRDGIHLYTRIYVPKGVSNALPILLMRTPYGVDRITDKPGDSIFDIELRELAADGYIFALQDIRGRQKSEGKFILLRQPRNMTVPNATDESTDTYDTIDWLLHHVGHNSGRVGMLGVSYGGWLTVMAALDPHPALKAVSPQAFPADIYVGDDAFHYGAFRVGYMFEYIALVERGGANNVFKFDTFDTYDWYLKQGGLADLAQRYLRGYHTSWDDMVVHPSYDAYWRNLSLTPHFGKIRIPTLIVSGWYDQEDGYGPFVGYDAWRNDDPAHRAYLVVGPWSHDGWNDERGRSLGALDFGSDTAKYFREKIQAPWFAYYLKNRRPGGKPPPQVMLFETGSNRWLSFARWPGSRGGSVRSLYLRASGGLSFNPPAGGTGRFDRYVSDPAKPVPYRPRPIESTTAVLDGAPSGWEDWLVRDQRFVESRPDVVSWESEPLQRDVVVSGPISAHIFAATSGTDSDWVVKLIDVYPDQYSQDPPMSGYELMVSSEILRGRFRNGLDDPQPIPANRVQEYSIDLHQRLHRFLRGHRIMVQIQSTWFPLYDRNPQRFVPNIFEATARDYRAATQTVYHSRLYPSRVDMRIEP